ncbi:MAG: hypothetical protein FWF88_10915 [Peptococcaceae bacterium]|nr:hypothetical protein [Peptococcaceae bacterium]
MRELVGYLRVDLKRAFVSPIFLLAAIGMALLLYISVDPEIKLAHMRDYPQQVIYLYETSLSYGFGQIALILGALPFGASFCLDWNHQFLKLLVIRADMARYATSKVFVCFLSGFSAIVLGQILFILILSIGFPLADPHSGTFENLSFSTYGFLLQQGHYALYFLFPVVAFGLGAAFYALMALLISTRIQNVFVVLTSPIIVMTLLQMLIGILNRIVDLPFWANPMFLLHGRFDQMPTLWASIAYQVGGIGLLSAGSGVIIALQMKRKVIHG